MPNTRKTVLYIEDDFIIALNNETAFKEELNAEIVTFPNHKKADEWLSQHPGQCDLVITDNDTQRDIPDTGLKWIPTFVKSYPSVPVIMLFAGEKQRVLEPLSQCGMTDQDIFIKDISVKPVIMRAKHLLEHGKQKHVGQLQVSSNAVSDIRR